MVEGIEGEASASKGGDRWWLMDAVMLDSGDAMMVVV